MTALVAVVLALATTSLTLSIAMKNGVFLGYGWTAPYLGAISLALYILAAILAFLHFRRERKKDAVETPPPPVQQTVSQNFNPQFNPQQNFYIGVPDTKGPTGQEQIRQEQLILEFLHRPRQLRPAMTHLVGDIASAVNMTMLETAEALERLYIKKLVFRSKIEAPGDFVYWPSDLA